MKTKFLFISLLLALAPILALAQTWQEVGEGGFSDGEARSQKMAVDGLTPYVAYSDDSNDNYITVKKYNGISWETVGEESFGEPVDELDFAIDEGNFYIAYSTGNTISVMTMVGGQWVFEGPFAMADGSNVSLSMWEGIPYIAYQDSDHSNKLSAQKLTSSGWEYLGEPGFTTSTLSNVVDFEVDGDVAYVAYRDNENDYKVSVMKFENGIWSVLGEEGFSGGTYDAYNGLAIYNNQPYVASWNADGQGAVYNFDGTNWQQVGEAISTGTGQSLSLRTSPLNELHIAYNDPGEENKAYVKKLNGGSWVGIGESVSLLSASNISMAFNTNGQPYLAYRDDWYLRKTTVVTFDIAMDVDDVIDMSDIQIYPNPTTDYIQIFGLSKPSHYTINNVLGSELKKGTLYENEQIDIQHFTNGLYFLNFENGSTIKFMKK